MEFEFFRGYKFEKEEDANKFFYSIPNVSYKKFENNENTFRVVLLLPESKHIETDAFIWQNIEKWKSYLGSVETVVN